jgi:uncharacterized protein YggE
VARVPTVTVTGRAALRVEPDEAVVWLTLSKLDDAPGPALADVSARANALSSLLDELGLSKTDRSTSGISVYEDFDHTRGGRRSLGHRANARVEVRITDPELIGRLVGRAAQDLAARVDGPRWRISAGNPVRLQAAREAAADASRKAQAYAAGAGAQLGRLRRLTESDEGHGMFRAVAAAAPMGGEEMHVEPGELEVDATVRATFELDLGDG